MFCDEGCFYCAYKRINDVFLVVVFLQNGFYCRNVEVHPDFAGP